MKIVSNGKFTYGANHTFTDNIASLELDDQIADAYKIMYMWKKSTKKIIQLALPRGCTLCSNNIHGQAQTCSNLDAKDMLFHPECIDIMANIVNNNPMLSFKLLIGDITELVPIYGKSGDRFVSRRGNYIEFWSIDVEMIDIDDLYSCIQGVINGYVATEDECYYCGIINDSMYYISVTEVCSHCGHDLLQFKNKLALIYTILRRDLIADISCTIVKMIIDVYN